MRRERLGDALVALLLGGFVLLFFADILFTGLNLYVRDIARIYYPERHVLASILRAGQFPFWNPLTAGGQPLAANPGYEVFYPPQWLLAIGDFRNAFHLEVILHYPLAAAGLYLSARSLGARRVAAAFGGFAYALGGTLLSLSNLLPFLFAMAWLPWLALFFRRFVMTRRNYDLAGAALTLSLILLIADVSMILQAGALIAAYAIHQSWRRRGRPGWLRPPVAAAAAVLIATLIGAIQIFPALDHQRDSGRAVPLSYDMVMAWPTHPLRLLESIWPTLFGSSSEYATFFWGTHRLGLDTLPWLMQIYPGVLSAILVLAGLILRIRGARFVAVVSAISVLLALGPRGGLFPALYAAGMTSVRYPEKFLLSAIFVLSVFAAVAADAAFGSLRVRRTATWIAGIVSVVTLAVVVWTTLPGFSEAFPRVWGITRDDDLARRFATGMRVTLILLAVTTILLAAERLSPRVRVALLALLAVVDLGVQQRGTMQRITSDYYTRPPVATRLLAGDPVRIYSHADWQRNNETQPGLPVGLRPWIVRNGLLPRSSMDWNIGGVLETDVTSTNLIPTVEFAQLFDTFRKAKRSDRFPLLLQMTGASHVGVLQPFDPAIVNDPRRFDLIDPVRFVPTNNSGRYYFASAIRPVSTREDVARELGSLDPIDIRTAFTSIAPFNPSPGRIVKAVERANEVSLDVAADGRALLVLAITPHKYWHATIDGRKAELHRANVGFQALILEAGAHRVELSYRNALIFRCAWISAFGVLIVIALASSSLLRGKELPAE